MKKNSHLPALFLFLSLLLIIIGTKVYFLNQTITKQKVFKECSGHSKNNKYHFHATLQIIQDGNKIKIPPNIGIINDCVHPLHTHDYTGVIHMDYPKKITFRLGDFFDMMGTIFNDQQIGSVKTSDGYTILLQQNNQKISKNYRGIILKDHDDIKIIIKNPKDSHP